MARPLIIVTDASEYGDDCIAIATLAAAIPQDIRLIVATSGNVWAIEAASHVHALVRSLECGNIPVCVAETSFEDRLRRFDRHADAIAYAGALALPYPRSPTSTAKVCSDEQLIEQIAMAPRPDLLVIGPATPIARLMTADRKLETLVNQIYLMGGAVAGPGNATPHAEFNFWFDAEAAETVLSSSIPVTLLPLDAIRSLHYPSGFPDQIGRDPASAAYVRDCLVQKPGRMVCDEALAAIVLDPSIVSRQAQMKLLVEISDNTRYGKATALDDRAPRKAAKVILEIDQAALWRLTAQIFSESH